MEIAKYVQALPEQAVLCYRAVQGQGLLVAGISLAKRIEGFLPERQPSPLKQTLVNGTTMK